MYRRELDLSVFSLTFSEQRLQLPSEAGEGGAGGLDSGVRKEGAGACVHVRSGFIPGVCFIKTRSSGTASGTCFGQEEEKQKTEESHKSWLTSAEPGLTIGKEGASLRLSEQQSSYIQPEKPLLPIPKGPYCPPGWTCTTGLLWMKHHNRRQRKCGPQTGEPTEYALGHRSSAGRMPVSQEVRGNPWEPSRGVAVDQEPLAPDLKGCMKGAGDNNLGTPGREIGHGSSSGW